MTTPEPLTEEWFREEAARLPYDDDGKVGSLRAVVAATLRWVADLCVTNRVPEALISSTKSYAWNGVLDKMEPFLRAKSDEVEKPDEPS